MTEEKRPKLQEHCDKCSMEFPCYDGSSPCNRMTITPRQPIPSDMVRDDALPEDIKAWMRDELRLLRFWVAAGPRGRGWGFHTQEERSRLESIRDWLEKFLGEDPNTDPWFERRLK